MSWLHKKGSFTPEMLKEQPVRDLLNETNRVLQHAVGRGITHDIPISQKRFFENDVFVFSGFKTYNQLKEASLLLIDENGAVKSFDRFKQDILQLENTYNGRYLDAEYNFAVSSAQMASKWLEMEADGDRYNLQYRTANDDRVRPGHATLHEITLPQSNPFWDRFYPPNDWNCRCTAVQVLKDKYPMSNSHEAQQRGDAATTKIGKNNTNSSAIFRFNPGKDKIIFPPTHPYRSPRCATCSKRHNLAAPMSIERCEACFEILRIAERTEARREVLDFAKREIIGQFTFEHNDFTANFTKDSFKKNLRYNDFFEAKADILKNIKSYMPEKNAEYQWERNHSPEKKPKIRGYYAFQTAYKGNVQGLSGQPVRFKFREWQSGDIDFYHIHFL